MEVHKIAKAGFLTNPEIFRINRLDAHSDHRYYTTLEAMQRGEDLQKLSLIGRECGASMIMREDGPNEL